MEKQNQKKNKPKVVIKKHRKEDLKTIPELEKKHLCEQRSNLAAEDAFQSFLRQTSGFTDNA